MAINLHAAVRGVISAINPPILGTWRRSDGYTTSASGLQIPAYIDVPDVPMQVQALSGRELAHMDSLNIQGVMRGFWLDGDVQAVNRVTDQGGDLLVIPQGAFLVVTVFETWDTGRWCHVAGQLQRDPAL